MFDDNKVSRNWLSFFAFVGLLAVFATFSSICIDARRTKELLASGLSPQAVYCIISGFETNGRLRQACVGVQK